MDQDLKLGGHVLARATRLPSSFLQEIVHRDERQDAIAVRDRLMESRTFDDRTRELLQAIDELKRNGHTAAGGAGEHEQRLTVVRSFVVGSFEFERSLMDRTGDAGPIGETDHIEDQADSAVAEDGRAREHLESVHVRPERLHHDLRRVAEPVDHEPVPPVVCSEHEQEAPGR